MGPDSEVFALSLLEPTVDTTLAVERVEIVSVELRLCEGTSKVRMYSAEALRKYFHVLKLKRVLHISCNSTLVSNDLFRLLGVRVFMQQMKDS